MATYKVLQDIEAEDTLVGPLTLRQCIYAAIAIGAIYLSVVFVTKGAAVLVVFTLPFIAFGVFFAFPWTKQQSTEIWALAKVRFYLKPRKRIWDQSGAKELVTITAPKNIKRIYSSTLTPNEVKSRLKALADTIDSRGWAVKNVDLGYYAKPAVLSGSASDRLVGGTSIPEQAPMSDSNAAADIFDIQNNPVAQKFDAMMTQAAGAHRQQIEQQLASGQMAQAAPQAQAAPAIQQTMPAAPQSVPDGQVVTPTAFQPAPQPQPAAAFWHMRTIQPTAQAPAAPVQPVASQAQPAAPAMPLPPQYSQQYAATYQQPYAQPAVAPTPQQPYAAAPATPQNPMTATPNPAILELANNNDLDIATIAREAQARSPEPPDGEVVISFH